MTNIFLNYDAEALEREYLPVHWPGVDLQAALDEWVERGEAYHQKAEIETDIPYGDSDRQRLDILHPEKTNAPVLVFIHGGYWRNKVLSKRCYGFCAEPIVNAGALVAMVEYDLCPEVTIDTIVAQVQKACAWLWRNVAEHGGDPTRLHISGHSAGGHLTAMMAATDWPALADDLPGDLVRSIVPISGLFELEPLRLSSLNSDFRLDAETAGRNSPLLLAPARQIPVSVVVGSAESNEFRRQSRDFSEAWSGSASHMAYIETPGHHHFSIIEAMTEPGNPLTATILRHLEL